jgi:hypothetical protein
MKHKFLATFGKHFDIVRLSIILDNMAEEEMFYWFAKCITENGIKAFRIMFDVKKRKYTAEEKEKAIKIIVRAQEEVSVYD